MHNSIKILYNHLWDTYHTFYCICVYGLDGAEKQINGELERLKNEKIILELTKEYEEACDKIINL